MDSVFRVLYRLAGSENDWMVLYNRGRTQFYATRGGARSAMKHNDRSYYVRDKYEYKIEKADLNWQNDA